MSDHIMTLTEFLLARIAEDEAQAREVHHRDCRIYLQLTNADCSCAIPARLLAECEAKRRIVERWEYRWDEAEAAEDAGLNRMYAAQATGLVNAIHFLASVYVDHPDYREEWRP